MSELEKFLKEVLLGGVGMVATAAEKAAELAHTLVNKGTEVVEEQKGPMGDLVQRGRGLAEDISDQMGRLWGSVCSAMSGKTSPTREERDELRERLNEMDELEEEMDTVTRGLDALMGHVGRAVERTGDAIARMTETLAGDSACPEAAPDAAEEAGEAAPPEEPAVEEPAAEEPAAEEPAADAPAGAAETPQAETAGPTVEDELRKALRYIRTRLDAPDAPSQPEMQALRQRMMDFAKDVYSAFQSSSKPDKPEDDGNG